MPSLDYAFTWTPDCQGKWDYDGEIIHVSTRYWGRGGSAHIFQGGQLVSTRESPERQHIKPSAHSTIYFMNRKLVDKEFEGETEVEVKQAVEEWVDGQIKRIEKRLIPMLYP